MGSWSYMRGLKTIVMATLAAASVAVGLGGSPAQADDGTAAALGWLASQQDARSGLVRSFAIPADDPDRALAPLAFTYDGALAALAFTAAGDTRRAAQVLEGLADIQAVDGSLPFAYDTGAGAVVSELRRTGTIAWAGYAAVRYEQVTGDDSFRGFAEGIADYLGTLQVASWNGHPTSDQRYGSILGGPDVEWASTEHNIDAYFFLRDLGRLPGESRYTPMASAVGDSLWLHHWDFWRERFFQGVSTGWPDPTRALDLSSWGGLFWLAHGRADLAGHARASMEEFRVDGAAVTRSTGVDDYNTTFAAPGPFSGYKPYMPDPGVESAPHVVWSEGTWGALLLRSRLGEDVTADVAAMQALQQVDPAGGYLQVTRGHRPPPFEYHAWPSVAGTAWAVIVLRDPAGFWAAD
jgi:hypothetical protein